MTRSTEQTAANAGQGTPPATAACALPCIDPDILDIAELSAILRCSVDTIRRIPLEELPIYRVGKANLYLREDVLRFLHSKRVTTSNIDHILQDVIQDLEPENPGVIELRTAEARERSSRRTP